MKCCPDWNRPVFPRGDGAGGRLAGRRGRDRRADTRKASGTSPGLSRGQRGRLTAAEERRASHLRLGSASPPRSCTARGGRRLGLDRKTSKGKRKRESGPSRPRPRRTDAVTGGRGRPGEAGRGRGRPAEGPGGRDDRGRGSLWRPACLSAGGRPGGQLLPGRGGAAAAAAQTSLGHETLLGASASGCGGGGETARTEGVRTHTSLRVRSKARGQPALAVSLPPGLQRHLEVA